MIVLEKISTEFRRYCHGGIRLDLFIVVLECQVLLSTSADLMLSPPVIK